jgi:hypothetical protein
MNVYKKLQDARVKLQGMPLKESGQNKFAGYSYMELGDFLPQINSICAEVGLCGIISFGEEATLTIVNTDKPEESVVFHSPMSVAELKGCHPVQNLGAVQSYLRRYLWIAAMDICEHDALDSTHDKSDSKSPSAPHTVPQQSPSSPEPNKDQEHIQRIKNALRTIYGDDIKSGIDKVEYLTSFVPKGKAEEDRVKGVRDFTKLSGQRLTILCSALEKLAVKSITE